MSSPNNNNNNNNNNKKKKPKKHIVDNYDYSSICNFPDCKEEAVPCPKCLERTGKKHLGHQHEHIKLVKTKYGSKSYEETATDIKTSIKIMHCHFALRKGTRVPELDRARNVWCKIGERWANKKDETYTTRKLKKKKQIPDYIKDDD